MDDSLIDGTTRFTYEARCPNGHPTVQVYRIEEWKHGFANSSGSGDHRIIFQCACGQVWSPTPEDVHAIRTALARRTPSS
jgi:hypothetical protein